MKPIYLIFSIIVAAASLMSGQCLITADDDAYTVDIDISATDVITVQNGTTCNAMVVLEYDITISDGGPSWWNNNLYSLQGTLDCDGGDGTSFFNLPNDGGVGTTTSANFSYFNTACEDVEINCTVNIEASGPGLSFDGSCGSVSLASLPVSFTKVYHREADGTYTIHWETAVEINSDRYQVMRSVDGSSWHVTAEVTSNNSRTGSQYSADIQHTNSSYYRVQNIDFNGDIQVSETILVAGLEDVQLSLFPNPASEHITVMPATESDYQLQILDMMGSIVLNQKLIGRATIDLSGWESGTYIYRVSSHQAGLVTGRFVKL